MAKNTNTTASKTANKTANNAAVNSVIQPDPITQLTALVTRLMAEITELKSQQAKPVEPVKTVKTSELKSVSVPANKTNVVPANKFVPIQEGTVISEVIMISSIGTPFGSKYGPRQAINCVTAHGNTFVAFINCVRDALGNAIPSGLVGGGKYVMTGTATGKTSEFNAIKSNVIGKAKFALAS